MHPIWLKDLIFITNSVMKIKAIAVVFWGTLCASLWTSPAFGQNLSGTSLDVSGTATIGTLATGTATINLLTSGTASFNELDITGVPDFQNNTLLFGTSGTNFALCFTYDDGTGGVGSSVTLRVTQPSAVWNWRRGTSAIAMQLDASNRLILTGTAATNPPQLVLDPNGTVTMNGSSLLTRASADSLYLSSTAGLLISNGNIGIGTITPAEKLTVLATSGVAARFFTADLNGVASVLSSNNGYSTSFNVENTGSGGKTWGFRSTASASLAGGGKFAIRNETDGEWPFVIDSNSNVLIGGSAAYFNPTMYVASAGNVGIGTTGPTSPLHIVNSISWIPTIRATNNAASGVILPMFLEAPNMESNSTLAFAIGKAASANNRVSFAYNHVSDGSVYNRYSVSFYGAENLLNVLASGNVGVGTTTPTRLLSVNGSAQFGDTISRSITDPLNVSFGGTYGSNTPGTVGNLKWDMFTNGANGNRYGIGMSINLMEYQAGTNGQHAFFVNQGTEAVRILANGNVGIGTVAPQAKLDVNGSAKIAGNLALSGTGSLTLPDGTVLLGSNTLKNVMASGTALSISGSVSASQVTGLSAVATTGNYNSLAGCPAIPTDNSQLANGTGYITSSGTAAFAQASATATALSGTIQASQVAGMAPVATGGDLDYSKLINAPTNVLASGGTASNLALSGTTKISGGIVVTGTLDSATDTVVASGTDQMLLVPQQGDLSMGVFNAGARPQ